MSWILLKAFSFSDFRCLLSLVLTYNLQYNIQNVDVSKNWRIKIKSIEKLIWAISCLGSRRQGVQWAELASHHLECGNFLCFWSLKENSSFFYGIRWTIRHNILWLVDHHNVSWVPWFSPLPENWGFFSAFPLKRHIQVYLVLL